MKSAYELAMERLGGTKEYTPEQKAKLAEIDSLYDAKEAETRIGADNKLRDAGGDVTKQEEIRDELKRDLIRLKEKREKEKDAVRKA